MPPSLGGFERAPEVHCSDVGQRAVEDATEPLRAMHGWMEEVICSCTACEPSVLPIWASRHTAA